MLVLISYDISSDALRRKAANVLEDYGERVQYSVFECFLDERSLLEVRRRLQEYMDFETDSVRIYRLCRRCVASVELFGRGELRDEPESLRIL